METQDLGLYSSKNLFIYPSVKIDEHLLSNSILLSKCFSSIQNRHTNNQIQGLGTHKYELAKTSFKAQIRKQHLDNIKRNMRKQLMQTLERNDLLLVLEKLKNKNQLSIDNLTNMLQDLKKNASQFQFCQKLDQNNEIKNNLINLYLDNLNSLNFNEKQQLLQTFVLLTYFTTHSINQRSIKMLIQVIKQQISLLYDFTMQGSSYLFTIIALITNFTGQYGEKDDCQIKYFVMDKLICGQIRQILKNYEKYLEKPNNNNNQQQGFDLSLQEQKQHKVNNLHQQFLKLLENMNFFWYENEDFFRFTMNTLIQDKTYFSVSPERVLKVLTCLLKHKTYRGQMINDMSFNGWYQFTVADEIQKRFNDPDEKEAGQFQYPQMTQVELDIFGEFLKNILAWIEYDEDEQDSISAQRFVLQTLNPYCLSECLILSSSTQFKNSKNIRLAIEMYQYISNIQSITLVEDILIVRKGREFEDILKIFLNDTSFTNWQSSGSIISFLVKLLDRNYKILQTFIELRIFDRIDDFLSEQISMQRPENIISFFDLLTIMIECGDQLSQEKNMPENRILSLLNRNGFLSKIEHYQDHKQRNVADKSQAFLKFFQAKSDCNEISQGYKQFDI